MSKELSIDIRRYWAKEKENTQLKDRIKELEGALSQIADLLYTAVGHTENDRVLIAEAYKLAKKGGE